MNIGIQEIAHTVGGNRLDISDLASTYGFDEAFIRDKIGSKNLFRATDDQASSDLCIEAAQAVLAKSGVSAESIGLVLVVTQTPDYQLPHTAALVQSALGIPCGAASWDVSLGCSGYVYALSIARSFMEANDIEFGLVLAVDCYGKLIDPADRATAPIFSDAAAATLMGPKPVWNINRGTFNTDGSGAKSLIVQGGGSRAPRESGTLFMDGRQILNFMMKRVPGDVQGCLEANGKCLEDVSMFVFHQANHFMLDSLRQRMKIPAERVLYAFEEVGNTVSASIPIALESIIDSAEKYPGILISGFGVGLSWASNYLTCSR